MLKSQGKHVQSVTANSGRLTCVRCISRERHMLCCTYERIVQSTVSHLLIAFHWNPLGKTNTVPGTTFVTTFVRWNAGWINELNAYISSLWQVFCVHNFCVRSLRRNRYRCRAELCVECPKAGRPQMLHRTCCNQWNDTQRLQSVLQTKNPSKLVFGVADPFSKSKLVH